MISPERVAQMEQSWAQLFAGLGVALADAYPVFDRLVAAYSQAHRHYHTLAHLHEMFRVAGRLSGHADDTTAVKLAVWFHDAVYDTHRHDNESTSADLAVDELTRLGLDADLVGRVGGLVRATDHAAKSPRGDTAVLLDADLAILGASPERYRRYAEDIRREYDWVSDEDFRNGRAQILERFLSKEHIYHTATLRAEGEEPARANLKAELAELRAG